MSINKKKEKEIEQKLNCEFIRTNPDQKDFDIYMEIDRIYDQIIETKEKTNQKINKQD